MPLRSAASSHTFVERSAGAAVLSSSRGPRLAVARLTRSSSLTRGKLTDLIDLWHLLSLDAPTVAVTWLLFVGSCTGIATQPRTALALFLAVWAIYAGDRLLDAQALPGSRISKNSPVDLEARHLFHCRHREIFSSLLALGLLVLGVLLCTLPWQIVAPEAVLATLLAAWLLRVHGSRKTTDPRRLPKEFIVGLFFALAIYLPSFNLLSAEHVANPAAFLPGAALFAGLCTLNCLFLYTWEHPHNLSRAHPATATGCRHLIPWSLLYLCAAAAAWLPTRATPPGRVPLACALGVGLLLTLHVSRHHLRPLRLRALADLVLLTPVLLLLPHRIGLHSLSLHWLAGSS